MSQNQSINQGVYSGVPIAALGWNNGNLSGGKASAILSCNTLNCQGGIVRNLAATQYTVSSNFTGHEVIGGLVTSNNAGNITLTFPSGFSATLLGFLGGATTAVTPSNLTVLLNQGLQFSLVNAGSGTVTLASADANTTLYNSGSPVVAAGGSRVFNVVFTNMATPAIIVY